MNPSPRPGPPYEIEGREVLAQVSGLRVQVLTVGPGECIPWHRHSLISDTFVCLTGRVRIETRSPASEFVLEPGERLVVPPDQPHQVTGARGERTSFVLVQGVGDYDYLAAD